MLNIYTSNQIESLISQLTYNIKASPLSSPLIEEVIAVNNQAMEKWLRVNITQIHGVEANYNFPLPASLLWSILEKHFDALPQQDPLNRSNLQWFVFSELPKLLDSTEFSVLKNYLQIDQHGIKRWQLAAKIADIFDRYQYYRPNWLELTNEESHWQKVLWDKITHRVDQHKTQMVERYIVDLQTSKYHQESLPERISLFAPSTLPPLVFNSLLQLSEVTQVDFYLLAPTNQYWLDLVSQKTEAKARLKNPDDAVYLETGNRLLSSWGRQGQVFFDQLIAISDYAEEFQHFQEPNPDSVLGQIKHDIFDLEDADATTDKIIASDDSIVLHVCHSPLREVQVLHNQLLNLFAKDNTLTPEDILIVAPDISQYSPYIDAVFRKTENKPFIPWNLSDTAPDKDIPLIRIFLQLFSLPESRFGRSEVLAYLDVPEVRQKFNLNEDEIEQIRRWLDAGAIRWGKDKSHKNALGLPAIEQNTWEQTKDRLFMGYAIGQTDELFDDISPVSAVEGNASESLGKFWRLYSALENHSKYLSKPQSLLQWQETINRLLETFFDDSQLDESYLQTIRDTSDQLIQNAQGFDKAGMLSRQLLRLILESQLSEASNLHHFMSGGVSFSGFKPMRNLPFKVIALLGMNDSSFPRQTAKVEFDLMQHSYVAGDPNSRDEDRYLFLETLLSAQDTVIISYIGRSLKDNTEKQPSVLVKELLDYIDIRFCAEGSELPYSQVISHQHRLQAYHPQYFQQPDSYDTYWCNIAKKIEHPKDVQVITWETEQLSEPDAAWREIDINRLVRFFRHPIRVFFQQRLGIYLNDHTDQTDDDEPFDLDFLEQYLLKARLLDEWLENRSIKTNMQQLHAEGVLPHGQIADEIMQNMTDTISPLIERADELLQDRQTEPLSINLKLKNTLFDDWNIIGSLNTVYPDIGLVEIKSGKLSGMDQVGFWVKYMVYRLSAPEGWCLDGHFIDIEKNYTVVANSISKEEAKQYLQDLLEYYWLGVCKPLALLPKSSDEMVRQGKKDKEFAGEYSTAWRDDFRLMGDYYDPYIQLALRGIAELPIDTQEFIKVSQLAYQFDLTKPK